MQSLSDLCLNKIEDSGADTRELAQIELPKQMWTRHPICKLSCIYYFSTGDIDGFDDDREFVLYKNIEISFTGIYTLKMKIDITDAVRNKSADAETFERICKHFGLTQTRYEKTFENLEGEFSDDELKYIRKNANLGRFYDFVKIARKNLVAYEVMKIIFSNPTSSHVTSSFGGKFELYFSELYEANRTDRDVIKYLITQWHVIGEISDKINLIRYVTYI
jgi:hypothetical protein